ncbi:MAG: ATP-binding protein, partial [Cyanobacteria bacterium P01_A01_bin.105]
MADRILNALQTVDFNWTTHINSIWKAPAYDVSDLHQRERAQLMAAAQQLQQATSLNSPLGQVLLGPPGAGKTHLLGAIRQQAIHQGIGFVLVDMTDVRDFWETVLQGYISSLREDREDGTPQFQLHRLVKHLINQTGHQKVSAEQLASLEGVPLKKGMAAILTALNKKYPKAVVRFQDVIRAVVLLNSEDFSLSDTGYSWLSGLEIDPGDKQAFRFKAACKENLIEIVEGLSWLMSLQSPWIIALDQLDAIVAQHHYATRVVNSPSSEEQQTSKQIIEGIGGGLMALRDKTARTQTVVSCLDVTWQVLAREVVKSFGDRFQKPIVLTEVVKPDLAAQLIAPRLQAAYQTHKIDPPYPTWPYAPSFFEDAARRGKLPRQILQRCDQHRQQCIGTQTLTELLSFEDRSTPTPSPSNFAAVEQAFQAAQQRVDVLTASSEIHEDEILGQWLQTVAYCLVQENPTPETVDAAIDASFPGGKRYPELHARVRLIYRAEGDRERHLSLRGLLRSHHAAYGARLKAAINTAGIDRTLSFRRLVLFRQSPPPSGAATQKLTDRFTQSGGLLVYPSPDELRVIGALHQLKQQNLPDFDRWLQQARPVSGLAMIEGAIAGFFDPQTSPISHPAPSAALPQAPSAPPVVDSTPPAPPTIPAPKPPTALPQPPHPTYTQLPLDQAPLQPDV